MIFTDRTITVRKGKSQIDEPIVVYRGDYELEVRFTILNSRFKFMSGTNMIESEKASYGQLAILTPYGGNIFSDIVRCNDGSVTFVLTAEMLNQIEEVGLYSFQIRLMDYNKESRVSIPPIEFGIEVREPIASEDHDNSVNNAIVGYSIAKVVDPKEENVGDTFNESGNYNKTKWETGDRISEGKLNKIEDAIDKINQNEMNNSASLSKRIDNNFNILESEVSRNTAEIDMLYPLVSSAASGGPKGVYANLNELSKVIPEGNSDIYITIDDGNWCYWDGKNWSKGGVYQSRGIESNSIKSGMIDTSISGGGNLFDKSTVIRGCIFDDVTGDIYYYLDDHAVSDYIPVDYNVISVNWSNIGYMIGMYDVDGIYLGKLDGGSKVYNLHPETASIRLNMMSNIIDTLTVVYGVDNNVLPLSYGSNYIEWLKIKDSQLPNIGIDKIDTFQKVGGNLLSDINLFRDVAVLEDTIVSLVGCTVTDYVRVKPNTKYYIRHTEAPNMGSMFNEQHGYIGPLNVVGHIFESEIPNLGYIRINTYAEYTSDLYMVEGGCEFPESSIEPYELDGLKIHINNVIDAVNLTVYHNMIDNEKITPYTVINQSDGTTMWFAETGVTDFIPIEPNTYYYIRHIEAPNFGAIYDDNYEFITNLRNLNNHVFSTNLANAKYIRMNIYNEYIDDSYMAKGVSDCNDVEPYELSGLKIDYKNIKNIPPAINSYPLSGKTIYAFGDSITYWDDRYSWFDDNYYMVGYVSHMKERLGCTVVNSGVAGYTARQITGILKGTDLTGVYAITYMAGANDIQQNVSIGELGSKDDTLFDMNTYIGCIKEAIKYVHTNYPKCKIYLLAPLQFRGRDITPYAEAMEAVGKMYGVPCLRLDQVVQINVFTDPVLTVEGLHPNNDGNALMADAIVPFLQNY